MRTLKNIKINESISRGKLIYNVPWDDKIQHLLVYFLGVAMTYSSVLIIPSINIASQNDVVMGSIFSFCGTFVGLCIIYRNAREKKLIKVHSNFDAAEAKRRLLDFARKEAFDIYKKDGYCLIFNEAADLDGEKSRIILIRDFVIYFTVLQHNPKLNRPVFTTHLFLKRALKKLLN